MITCWGGGSVLGSLAARKLDERREPRALFWGVLVFAFATGAIAVSPWFPPILVMTFVSGFGDAVTMVAEQGIQQRRTPDAVRSRVVSAADAIITVSFTASLAVAGVVLRALGPQDVYAVGGLAALAGAAVLTPVFRSARRAVEPEISVAAIDPEAAVLEVTGR
jgi:predicted MFS family arabinose efflux permease